MRKGIAVIHGIGSAEQSATLLRIGQPLLLLAKRWMEAQGRVVRFHDGTLAFGTVDDGRADVKPHVAIAVAANPSGGAVDWVMAEAWWSHSYLQPGFLEMVAWAWAYWRTVALHLIRMLVVGTIDADRGNARSRRLAHKKPGSSDPGIVARALDALNNAFLLALSPFVLAGGLLVLGLLFAVAQIPIKALQEFIVVKLLRQLLVVNIAQFRAFLEDETQAANMRRRLEETLAFLAYDRECDELFIIAHSGGVPIVFDTLAHPERPAVAQRVRKVFSLGEGLNKAWEIHPREPRLQGPIMSPVRWIDFWTSYDPVPAGPIQPPSTVAWPPDFESNEVTYHMDVLTDHSGYWRNEEQVLWRMAQEIDTPTADRRDSQFWRGARRLRNAVRWRRWRASILAALRMFVVVLYAATLIGRWPDLLADGLSWWQAARLIPGVAGATDPLFQATATAGNALVALLGDLSSAPAVAWCINAVRATPGTLFGAFVLALPFWGLFELIAQPRWERWDRLESARTMYDAAQAPAPRPAPVTPTAGGAPARPMAPASGPTP